MKLQRDAERPEIRINRYIMECKLPGSERIGRTEKRINRYIMECKCLKALRLSLCVLELIDTLWNVNACAW